MRIVNLFFFFFFLIQKTLSTIISSSSSPITITNNFTISSPQKVFELGWFSSTSAAQRGEHSWYLGIWYKRLPHEVVWVANRDRPLPKPHGTLVINVTNFMICNQIGEPVFRTNVTYENRKSAVVLVELLDNGNLVLRYKEDSKTFLWQSFDFPTDTLLPDMKLGWDSKLGFNRQLQSWRSDDDPSGGDYIYGIGTHKPPETYLWKDGKIILRSGPWSNSSDVDKIQLIEGMHNLSSEFTVSDQEISFSFKVGNSSIISILRIGYKGILNRSTWILLTSGEPKKIDDISLRNDSCDSYGRCGPNGFCDVDTTPNCRCIEEYFRPVYQGAQESRIGESGCVRKTPTKCYGDDFFKLQRMKLPETKASNRSTSSSFDECKKTCLEGCECTAFAYAYMANGEFVCIIWTQVLIDMRKSNDTAGQDLYVRVKSIESGGDGNLNKTTIVIIIIVGVVVFFLGSFTIFWIWKRNKKNIPLEETSAPPPRVAELHTAGIELPHTAEMEFENIAAATDGFSDSNKIGRGGFGIVYKGMLVDGREIAVKRLLKKSNYGIDAFKNELRHIVNLQHLNLVRLYGYCFSGDEMLLVYEYLENSSLDTFIFDERQSFKLDWEKRVEIIIGICRGLLYLHQDSRYPIIHRDLKPGNILLDRDMIPKISDFGIAKSFVKGAEAETTPIVGTFGYMPEDGICSTRSDVYSFGIVLFEIISGKKNSQFIRTENQYLLHYIWRCWENGIGLDIIDPVALRSSTFNPREALRLIQIGFLCVQPDPDDRPTMSSVSAMFEMLKARNLEIPKPNPPPLLDPPRRMHTGSSSTQESWTLAQLTYSPVQPK